MPEGFALARVAVELKFSFHGRSRPRLRRAYGEGGVIPDLLRRSALCKFGYARRLRACARGSRTEILIPRKGRDLDFVEPTERVGFEPTVGARPTAVFKTAAFNHSATSPAVLPFSAAHRSFKNFAFSAVARSGDCSSKTRSLQAKRFHCFILTRHVSARESRARGAALAGPGILYIVLLQKHDRRAWKRS